MVTVKIRRFVFRNRTAEFPTRTFSNCLFVNCGSGYGQRAYYGGVNNHNGGTVNVNHCTFDLCLSGVTLNDPKDVSVLNVSNCIFNRIGYNAIPASDFDGLPPLDAEPFALWFSPEFPIRHNKSRAVFNKYKDSGLGELNVTNCIVNDIAEEDTGEYLPGDPPLGTRLSAGEVNMTGVVREEPLFVNTDYTAGHPPISWRKAHPASIKRFPPCPIREPWIWTAARVWPEPLRISAHRSLEVRRAVRNWSIW